MRKLQRGDSLPFGTGGGGGGKGAVEWPRYSPPPRPDTHIREIYDLVAICTEPITGGRPKAACQTAGPAAERVKRMETRKGHGEDASQ